MRRSAEDLTEFTELLKAVHGGVPAGAANDDGLSQTPDMLTDVHIAAFTDQLLYCPESEVTEQCLSLLDAGLAVDTLIDTLLTGCAHHLGERWVDDKCSFADVTLGMTTLHRLLHLCSADLGADVETRADQPAICITPVPGDAHIFAAAMLGSYFRAAGWRVTSGIHEAWGHVIQSVEERHLDVVAITVSSGSKIEASKRLISHVRARAKSRRLKVIIGGPPFDRDPHLHTLVGADATAANASGALSKAAKLLGPQPSTQQLK